MAVIWKKTLTGMETCVPSLVPFGARIVGAVLLSPFAAAFGSALVSAVRDLRHAEGTDASIRAVAGALAVLLFFLLTAFPPWALLVGRRLLVLDHDRRLLVVNDFRVFRWTRAYPTDQIAEIAVIRRLARTRSSHSQSLSVNATVFVVRLRLESSGRHVEIARQNNAQNARAIAGPIADSLGKTVFEV